MEKWIHDYIQNLSNAEYHLQIILLIIFIGFILFKIYKTHQRYRFINDTATSRIASAPQGYVELKGLGELIAGTVIRSPFSQRRCLWYQCIVERRKRLNKYTVWVEESNDTSDHLFHLKDDTGVCVIIPDGAYIIPSEKTVWYGRNYEAKYQGKLKHWWFNRFVGFGRYRFTEKMITVAEPLYIIGDFESVKKNISTSTLQQQVEELVTRWKQQPARYLTKFDRDQNGKIQKQEWKLVRQQAELEIRKQFESTVHHTIKRPAEKNHPFVISTRSERQLLKQKRQLLVLYSALFFLLFYVLLLALKNY